MESNGEKKISNFRLHLPSRPRDHACTPRPYPSRAGKIRLAINRTMTFALYEQRCQNATQFVFACCGINYVGKSRCWRWLVLSGCHGAAGTTNAVRAEQHHHFEYPPPEHCHFFHPPEDNPGSQTYCDPQKRIISPAQPDVLRWLEKRWQASASPNLPVPLQKPLPLRIPPSHYTHYSRSLLTLTFRDCPSNSTVETIAARCTS